MTGRPDKMDSSAMTFAANRLEIQMMKELMIAKRWNSKSKVLKKAFHDFYHATFGSYKDSFYAQEDPYAAVTADPEGEMETTMSEL